MAKDITKEEFIRRSKEKYDDKYRFYHMHYVNYQTPVWIECQDHGLFKVVPKKHIDRNQECPHCRKERERLIIENKLLDICHNHLYCDTSRLRYENSNNKLILKCTYVENGIEHKEYTKLAEEIYEIGYDENRCICPQCAIIKRGKEHTVSKEEFIRRSKSVHGDLYNYDNIKYTKISDYVYDIWCTEHNGYFNTLAHNHRLYKCNVCYGTEVRSTEQFIHESNLKHNYFYTYEKSVYINNCTEVTITCPKHGDFKRLPTHHINSGIGCNTCIQEESSSLSSGELSVKDALENLGIKYMMEYTFENCRYINPLPFDFYLPEYNLCIEYDGKQHFNAVKIWGGEERFTLQKERDMIKNQFCKDNNINLLRIPYFECDPQDMIEEYINVIYKNVSS